MIKRIFTFLVVLLFAASGAFAQTVKIYDVVESPGDILVPVDMLDFTNVGAITLVIDYDADLLEFAGIENAQLTNGDWLVSGNVNPLTISFTANTSAAINGKLLDLKFRYSGGFYSALNFTDASYISDFDYVTIPADFQDGSITQITTDNIVSLVNPGPVLVGNTANVPVTIEGPGFVAVNSITFKIAYDPEKLTYVGKVENGITGVKANSSISGIVTLVWEGGPLDFTTLTELVTLKFAYYGGGDAPIEFFPGCVITQGVTPLPVNYINTVISPYFEEPILALGHVIGIPGTVVTVPLTAADFNGYQVGTITLKIGYDVNKLAFGNIVPHQGISGWNTSASGGVLTIQWSGATALYISDGLLLELRFNYIGGGVAPLVFKAGTDIKTIHNVTIPVEFISGSVSPIQYKVSGTLKYANNAGTPLTNSTVQLWNSDATQMVATTTTNILGYYEFPTVPDGDYILKAATAKPVGGIDVDDYFDIYYHLVGLFPLSGVYLLAADMNQDGIVDVDDLFDLYYFLLGTVPPNYVPWVFENPSITVSGGDLSIDIRGLCTGDVNGSHVPAF